MQKEQKTVNKIFVTFNIQYFGKRFRQKSNRGRHVKTQHEDGTFDYNTNADEIVRHVNLTFLTEFEHDVEPPTSN